MHGDGGIATEATTIPRRWAPLDLNQRLPRLQIEALCQAELEAQMRKSPASTMAHRVFPVTCVGAVP